MVDGWVVVLREQMSTGVRLGANMSEYECVRLRG